MKVKALTNGGLGRLWWTTGSVIELDKEQITALGDDVEIIGELKGVKMASVEEAEIVTEDFEAPKKAVITRKKKR